MKRMGILGLGEDLEAGTVLWCRSTNGRMDGQCARGSAWVVGDGLCRDAPGEWEGGSSVEGAI